MQNFHDSSDNGLHTLSQATPLNHEVQRIGDILESAKFPSRVMEATFAGPNSLFADPMSRIMTQSQQHEIGRATLDPALRGSMGIYRLFFENMEESRAKFDTTLKAKSPANRSMTQTAVRRETATITATQPPSSLQFQNPQARIITTQTETVQKTVTSQTKLPNPANDENRLINFIQRELESQLDVSDMSIKNIINEGILGVYDDVDYDADNILQPLHDNPYFMHKQEQPVMDQMLVADREHNPDDGFPFDDYINLEGFPMYMNPQFMIFLKATSLFNSSLLFENELMSIYCRTDKAARRGEFDLSFYLTFRPNIPGTYLSLQVESTEHLQIQPAYLSHHTFASDFEVAVHYRQLGSVRIVDFPMLKVSVASPNFAFDCRVPLPFSVNKFVHPCQMTLDGALKYLEHVS